MNTDCTCSNKKEHDPWCDLAEDFSRTEEMDAIQAKRDAEKAANDAKFAEVAAILGTAPFGLWNKVTQNPAMSAAQIAGAIMAGSL